MSTEPDDDPAEAQRPRRPRLTIAAVAAAVLLAGGGGAWWAAANGGRSDKPSPAPLRMDGPGLSADVTGGGPAPTAGGGATYQLTGKLPKGPDDAPVYRASGPVPKSDVQHLASLLGVRGAVTSDHGSWRVGGGTEGGPALLVGQAAPGTWSYTRNGPPAVGAQPDDATTSSAPADTDSGSGAADSGSAPVSEAAAKAAAEPVLDGLGLSGAVVDASQTVGAMRTVNADPKVGGLPTHGWITSLQVGPDGAVTLGYGRLSDLAKGDTYPVVSAATALKELNSKPVMHPDYGISSCQVPLPEPGVTSTQAPTTAPGQDKALPHSVPCVPDNGHPTQVRGATFGLALEYVSGVQTLVPAWLFDTAPAGVSRTSVVAQTAVDPSYIQGGPPGGRTTVPPASPASPAPTANPGGPDVSASPGSPPNAKSPRHVAVDSYTSSGSTLTLTYFGGLCDTYTASASESGGQVKVSVIATPKKPGTMCPAIARSFTLKVTLEQPLGTRTVVDTSDGQPVRGQ